MLPNSSKINGLENTTILSHDFMRNLAQAWNNSALCGADGDRNRGVWLVGVPARGVQDDFMHISGALTGMAGFS